jgi:2-iminobutanoate/2-iminopropanoate deaminase
MPREPYVAKEAHQYSSSFAVANRAGDMVFISGMVAAYPDGRIVHNFSDLEDEAEARKALSSGMWARDWNEGPIMAQTWFIFKNMEKLLNEMGGSLDDIVNLHVYMLDIRRDWLGHETARRHFFGKRPPAISAVEIGALVPYPGALIEIEAYAYLPQR